jgi:hypothetical protein
VRDVAAFLAEGFADVFGPLPAGLIGGAPYGHSAEMDELEFAFIEDAGFVGVVETLEDDFVHGVPPGEFVVQESVVRSCLVHVNFSFHCGWVCPSIFIEEQLQILRLTTPTLKTTRGAPFAQDDSLR